MKLGLTHALQIATLAVWTSTGVGAYVGYSVEQPWKLVFAEKTPPLALQTSIDLAAPVEVPTTETPDENATTTENAPPAVSEAVPDVAPPPMPEVLAMADLPEIPDLPAPVIRKTAQKVATPQPKANTPKQQTSSNQRPSAAAKPSNTPPSSATSLSFGSGAGRQPAPAYPLQARRSNQQGTVVVEFIVGTDGKVLSAWVKSPCPYPLLNQAALSTIRSRWKFPSGAARRYKIPIVFRLS